MATRERSYDNFLDYVRSIQPAVNSTIMDYIRQAEAGSDGSVSKYYEAVSDYPKRKSGYRRPGLTMLTTEMFGGSQSDALLPAAALQASEEWILLHDDAVDDSETRRAKPTLHKIYGFATAINAGDTLHMINWKMLSNYARQTGQIGNRVYDEIYQTLLRTADGQYMELNFMQNVKDMNKANFNLYLKILKEKTCRYSVMVPMTIGAIITKQTDKTIRLLEEIGAYAGIAFQMKDDILDMTGDEKKFGKKRFGDLYEGKLTAIMLFTYQNASADERKRIDMIYKKRREEKSAHEIGYLCELIEKYEGLSKANELVDFYGAQAELRLEEAKDSLPDNKFRKIFASAVAELYRRGT